MKKNILNDPINSETPYIFKFRTDALEFKIDYKCENCIEGNFPQVGVTAREGIISLFRRPQDKSWLYMNAYSKNSPVKFNMGDIIDSKTEYEVMLYGPILADLTKLTIEMADKYTMSIIKEYMVNKITIAGGIHSFGIGCTTTGMMFSNIIGRKTNTIINNLAIYNNNHLKRYHEKYIEKNEEIAYSDICILEIDSYLQKEENVENYLDSIIKLFESKCNKLICWYALPNNNPKKRIINEITKRYSANNNIIFEDCSFIYDEEHSDMCIYSNNFINDTANVLIYKQLKKWI